MELPDPPSTDRPGWVLRGDEVAGRLVWAGVDQPYQVVVDGRTVTWEEFGRALASFEGWSFRLRMTDPAARDEDEDREGDDEVVRLPVAEGGRFDPLGELFGLDEEDEEEFLRQWDEAEHDAAVLIRDALPDVAAAAPPQPDLHAAAGRIRAQVASRAWPYRHVAAAAGWHRTPPADDVELWLAAAGALVSMREDSGMGAEAESAFMALDHTDWLGAVVGLVRVGVGGRAEPGDLVRYLNDTPEVDGEIDPSDSPVVEGAFALVLPVWEAVGALDEHRRLTPLGWWGLPRALAWAWNSDFDNDDR